ncbi:pancreatic lipase-related protein 2 [Strongylocentrotus purpuratus]|uniref:Lipase domain-containing protein n=1 Tax=Strongylocentrotus purpuratus TaxID=7668 RepID=A0A7M7G416_STRPU|nr:pancreatic lipase-related protein 2 [Strongylocentrotus purpuratus]|eukprot:XP_001198442.2 PREDICTED: pancreatic lipase-related protein 2 [Strongylocentrotus purpuratus]
MDFFRSFAGLASILTAFMGPTTPPSSEVCFGKVGCFSNILPCHSFEMSRPEDINTRFFLFTRLNRDKAQEITWRDVITIEESQFNGTRPTKFVIHGWIENTRKSSFIKMKNTLLDNEDVNVIMVDWRGGSLDIYENSVQNIRVVGREIAILARKLDRLFNAPLSSMHAIGHSLGAHTAGYAGSELSGFGRITAMDPAGPYFRGPQLHPDCRLDRTDALFVDVIHTDGTNTSSFIMGMNGLGLQEQIGHQDFYPNGGKHMPGCLPLTHCSHYRAVYYFTQSISTCSYQATHRCDSWDLIANVKSRCPAYPARKKGKISKPRMGYYADSSHGEGAFYLRTGGSFPYC